MKKINYRKLYIYFSEKEGLSTIECLRNIWRTRNLPKEFKEVIYEILEGKASSIKEFSVDGISIESLYRDENMTLIQAVFFLEWLRREPYNARIFMASRRFREPLHIDSETKNTINVALENIESKTEDKSHKITVPEDKSEQDIDVEHEGPLTGVMTSDALQIIENKKENNDITSCEENKSTQNM